MSRHRIKMGMEIGPRFKPHMALNDQGRADPLFGPFDRERDEDEDREEERHEEEDDHEG